ESFDGGFLGSETGSKVLGWRRLSRAVGKLGISEDPPVKRVVPSELHKVGDEDLVDADAGCGHQRSPQGSVPATCAGLPTTWLLGGTSWSTTAPAATMLPWPTVTPGRMIAPRPIQQPSSMLTGLGTTSARRPYDPG